MADQPGVLASLSNIYFDWADELHPRTGAHYCGRVVLFADRVVFTGRTVRAALDQLWDFGRPKSIWLAVLVDRGHRELPIAAQYVGRKFDSRRKDLVKVKVDPAGPDDGDQVILLPAEVSR